MCQHPPRPGGLGVLIQRSLQQVAGAGARRSVTRGPLRTAGGRQGTAASGLARGTARRTARRVVGSATCIRRSKRASRLRSSWTMSSQRRSVSSRTARRSLVFQSGNLSGSGDTCSRPVSPSHWPKNRVTSVSAPRRVEHPSHLTPQRLGVRQGTIRGEVEQPVVGHARPEEIGQAGREFERRQPVCLRGVAARATSFNPEQEVGRRQHRLNAGGDRRLVRLARLDGCNDKVDDPLRLDRLGRAAGTRGVGIARRPWSPRRGRSLRHEARR